MTQLNEISSLENGARFLNVDLHIHSYGASHDVADSTMTPEAIVDSAVEQNLSVIAITDHNSNQNVERAIEYSLETYPGQILVLPGVEVTTAHGHLLAYFAPERTADLTKFLMRLDLIGEMGDDNTHTAKSMADTISEAEKLGGICIAAHIDREKTGFEMFSPSFPNWKKDIIRSPGLYGLECDSIDSLAWYSQDDSFGSAGAERHKIFQSRETVKELSGRHHLAHVQGSDSHTLKQFRQESIAAKKTWTRIKLNELSFEALRVALIDPTARVRACASIPISFPRIHGVSIHGGFLHNETIHFSDNLNCLVGGRGTGKSTVIRAIAYVLGINDMFGGFENCPNSATVFCEDANGILYRYSRTRYGEIQVDAIHEGSTSEMPIDVFHVEYFGQGELAKIAEDPLKNPQLFQEFLDRHTNLRDLIETEKTLVSKLHENVGRLQPLEIAFGELKSKKKSLEEIERKLVIAEKGKLREVVGVRSKLATEKSVRETITQISEEYSTGWDFGRIQRSMDQIIENAGVCTEDPESKRVIEEIKKTLDVNNEKVKDKQKELNDFLKSCASDLKRLAAELKRIHNRMDGEIANKLSELKDSGVATDIPGLDSLFRQKTLLTQEISQIEQLRGDREKCWQDRRQLLSQLKDVREQMTIRRKEQLKNINKNLRRTLKDYLVFVRYDESGITSEFEEFLQEEMHGTYLQDKIIETVCSQITPSELAELVQERQSSKIANITSISKDWAQVIVEKLRRWRILFSLQVLSKPPKPIITVRTKTTPNIDIPVLQLSDGQRHTILLTIAMLSDSNDPLIIDQPEDDLDNAFIFTSIVSTLRAIKEKRQVILVTHNANIAVLGDSELILPMYRENDCGKAKDRGSIDSHATKKCVIEILEGGSNAFIKRKEIYNH